MIPTQTLEESARSREYQWSSVTLSRCGVVVAKKTTKKVPKNKPCTQAYLADLDNMHKVVLEAKDEEQLKALGQQLTEAAIDHKMWVEQPENYPT